MKKLIKLSEDHYIIVDDSRKSLTSKGGSGYYLGYDHKIYSISDISNKPVIGQITHSTQYLGFLHEKGITTANLKPDWTNVKYMSLSEVQEAIYGYSVEKMAQSAFTHPDFGKYKIGSVAYYNGYKDGLKAHQELTKDKLFTVDDMWQAFDSGVMFGKEGGETELECFNRELKDILPKTEWEVEFIDGKIKLL